MMMRRLWSCFSLFFLDDDESWAELSELIFLNANLSCTYSLLCLQVKHGCSLQCLADMKESQWLLLLL